MADATRPTFRYERPTIARREPIPALLVDSAPSSDPLPDSGPV